MTRLRIPCVAVSIVLITAWNANSVHAAANIQILSPVDQAFVNTGGGSPGPVDVTYQVTGNTCIGVKSSFNVVPYVNGVPVGCSGAGCSCDGTSGSCNNITRTITLDGNDFDSCVNTIQVSLDNAPFTPAGCITPGPAIFSGTVQVWQSPYKECTGPVDCNKSTVGGPIDVATGKMYHEMADLVIRGPLPIEFVRRYDSQSNFNGAMGFGWQHSYQMRIATAGTNRAVLVDQRGRSIYFAKVAVNNIPLTTWDENRIEHLVLTEPGTPAWRVTDKHQAKYEFDSNGRLTKIADRNNNQVTLGYPGSNLETITDFFGRTITLTYVGGRIDNIAAGGRTVSYTYDGVGNLVRVDYPDGSFFTYQYDPAAGPHNLSTVLDALNHVVEDHDYDGSDRVMHFEVEGGVRALTVTYDSPTQTTVTNSRGVPTIYTHAAFSGLVTVSNGPGCASCGGGGAITSLTYDQFLNVTERQDGRGILIRMTYDGKGNVLTRKEAVGTPVERTWTFTYNPTFSSLVTMRIPTVGTCTNTQKVTTNTYDGTTGDLLQLQVTGCEGTTPFAFTTVFTYDSHGQVRTVNGPRTDVSDVTTSEYYPDADTDLARRGRLMRTTNAVGHQTLFNGYDLFGNVGTIRDANMVETTFTYDAKDRLLERRIKGAVTAEDIVTINQYDLAGRLDLVRLPNCVDAGSGCLFSIDYGYDGANRVTEVRNAVGNRIAYAYDSESNRTREETVNAMSAVRRFTNFAFDSLNRPQYVYFTDIMPEMPVSVFWKFTYDGNGNRTVERDPEGHVTTYTFDELNRRKTVAQTVGLTPITTQYAYDIQDNLSSLTDARGLVTSYLTSDMGWRLRVTSPETGVTTQVYDPAGNPITTTDNKGTMVARTYDALDRLLTVSYPTSSLNVSHTYDSVAVSFGIGRRSSMADPSGTTVFRYNRRGLRTREEKTVAATIFTTQYAYDKIGNRTQVLYPTSDPLSRQGQADFSFDAADRIAAVTSMVNGASTGVASGLTYEPYGPLTAITFGNGRVDSRTHDSRYRIVDWNLSGLLSYTHGYDQDDNLAGRTDNLAMANNRAFGYDAVHRLTNASGPWGLGMSCGLIATYTYDANGNRTCKGEGASSTTYSYSPSSNQIASAIGAEPATYPHDLNGNVTGDGAHTYQFDDADRLAQVDAGATATYTYDGEGRRTIKVAGGKTTYYFYDPDGRLLTETIQTDETGRDYLYLGELPLARVDWSPQELLLGDVLVVTSAAPNVHLDWTAFPASNNRYMVRRKQIVDFSDKSFNGNAVIAMPQDPTRVYDDSVLLDANAYFYRVLRRILNDSVLFYHADHLGTPVAMTDTGGSFVWRIEHLPFGGIHSLPVNAASNNLRFPGQYDDSESGLYQNWFRDYDSRIGRYREPDPLGQFVEQELYPYVANNPGRWFDVLGLYRKGDVARRKDPRGPGEDVTFIWDDPTPDQDGNGDELIVAFGNPKGCPQTCSGKAQITQINSAQDPYAGWTIEGSYKPWIWRATDAEYQRRWNEWQQFDRSWTPAGIEPAFQCYTLVNELTSMFPTLPGRVNGVVFGPKNLKYWKRLTPSR